MSGSLFLRRCGMWRCGVQCAARASEGRGGGGGAPRGRVSGGTPGACAASVLPSVLLKRIGFAFSIGGRLWEACARLCTTRRRAWARPTAVHCIGALAAISPAHSGGLGMTCFPCRCVFAGVSKGNAFPFAGGGSCAAPACRAGCRAGCARDLWRASARLLKPSKRFVAVQVPDASVAAVLPSVL